MTGKSDGIVAGYDGSPGAGEALRWAVREARERSTVLTVCLAWARRGRQPAAGIGGLAGSYARARACDDSPWAMACRRPRPGSGRGRAGPIASFAGRDRVRLPRGPDAQGPAAGRRQRGGHRGRPGHRLAHPPQSVATGQRAIVTSCAAPALGLPGWRSRAGATARVRDSDVVKATRIVSAVAGATCPPGWWRRPWGCYPPVCGNCRSRPRTGRLLAGSAETGARSRDPGCPGSRLERTTWAATTGRAEASPVHRFDGLASGRPGSAAGPRPVTGRRGPGRPGRRLPASW